MEWLILFVQFHLFKIAITHNQRDTLLHCYSIFDIRGQVYEWQPNCEFSLIIKVVINCYFPMFWTEYDKSHAMKLVLVFGTLVNWFQTTHLFHCFIAKVIHLN